MQTTNQTRRASGSERKVFPTIEVIVYRPGSPPEDRTISAGGFLAEAQAIVGGWVEAVLTARPNLILLCNEVGRIHRLPYNRWELVGTFLAIGARRGKPRSLTPEDRAFLNAKNGER